MRTEPDKLCFTEQIHAGTRITCETPEEKAEHISEIIGNSISLAEAHRLLETLQEREFITLRERLLMEVALRHSNDIWADIRLPRREKMFAGCLKRMLRALMIIGDEKE